jgi:MOSC domain-containing protein YiiM
VGLELKQSHWLLRILRAAPAIARIRARVTWGTAPYDGAGARPPRLGGVATVQSIHVAKATRLPMRAVERVTVEAGKGIVGDRYHGTKHRHVTVQSATALQEATEVFGGEVPRDPGDRLRIGDVLLEVVRVAAPCKLLDDTIGRGAQEALRRRGGSVCRVLEGGEIGVGDEVELIPR